MNSSATETTNSTIISYITKNMVTKNVKSFIFQKQVN